MNHKLYNFLPYYNVLVAMCTNHPLKMNRGLLSGNTKTKQEKKNYISEQKSKSVGLISISFDVAATSSASDRKHPYLHIDIVSAADHHHYDH